MDFPSFKGAPGRSIAWLVFALVTAASYGNFYVYDSIGPIADLLHRQRDFTDTQIGMFGSFFIGERTPAAELGRLLGV
jgi:hypothetical protein